MLLLSQSKKLWSDKEGSKPSGSLLLSQQSSVASQKTSERVESDTELCTLLPPRQPRFKPRYRFLLLVSIPKEYRGKPQSIGVGLPFLARTVSVNHRLVRDGSGTKVSPHARIPNLSWHGWLNGIIYAQRINHIHAIDSIKDYISFSQIIIHSTVAGLRLAVYLFEYRELEE